MVPFTTEYSVKDTKSYHSKNENKIYLITSSMLTIEDTGIHGEFLCKHDISNSNHGCIPLTNLRSDPSNFIQSYKISIDEINHKLYLFSNIAFCVFDLNTNKWNYITRHNYHGDVQSFVTIYKGKEKICDMNCNEEDKKAHYDYFVDIMQNKFCVEFDDKFPIEYDPKLKHILDNTEFICICGGSQRMVDIDGISLNLVSSQWSAESVAYLPVNGGKYSVHAYNRILRIWYSNDINNENRDILIYDLPVDGVWRFVLVKDRVIIAWHPNDGLVYLIDTMFDECYESAKDIYKMSGMIDVMVLYDERNDDLLFIKYGGCNHLRMSLREVLPIYFYADDLVNGYIREHQDLFIPLPVIKIIIMHFPCVLYNLG